MIDSLYIYRSSVSDPYENLAREQVMLENGPDRGIILYLWQNEKTVVIGRNQNAFKECRLSLLENDGGHLARRLSGGGAVFHDIGNLNFTFIMPRDDFDVGRQMEVICRACRNFGISAEVSGRNDLTVDGKKFSGSAFYKSGKRAYHHGTLLLSADTELISRYLNPPVAKLKSKGVDSVKSRVINLCSIVPEITCDALCKELVGAAENIYEFTAQPFCFTRYTEGKVMGLKEFYSDKKWLLGSNTPATLSLEETFSWGTLTLEFHINRGIISHISVFTDAMDWELSGKIKKALKNSEFSGVAIKKNLTLSGIETDIVYDICSMIKKQEI